MVCLHELQCNSVSELYWFSLEFKWNYICLLIALLFKATEMYHAVYGGEMTSRETSVLSQIINIWSPCIWKQRAFLCSEELIKRWGFTKKKKKKEDIRKKIKGLLISWMVHTWIEYLREMKLENIPFSSNLKFNTLMSSSYQTSVW